MARTAVEVVQALELLKSSPLVAEAQDIIKRFIELVNPIFMGMCKGAINGQSAKDDQFIFCFEDVTSTVGEFRSLMGDERELAKEWKETHVAPGPN